MKLLFGERLLPIHSATAIAGGFHINHASLYNECYEETCSWDLQDGGNVVGKFVCTLRSMVFFAECS
jgi:hypothetical protein